MYPTLDVNCKLIQLKKTLCMQPSMDMLTGETIQPGVCLVGRYHVHILVLTEVGSCRLKCPKNAAPRAHHQEVAQV